MKNSIISTGGNYSTSRMITDYTDKLYIPLCNITNNYYNNLEKVTEYAKIKENLYANWDDIEIKQTNNLDNISIDAGNNINVSCSVKVANIEIENIEAQVYYGKITEKGIIEDINVIQMELKSKDESKKVYDFEAKIEMKTGGNYGYTFRVMPKHEMLLDSANLNLIKWITK
jgi:starch phosphorylase